MQDLSGKKWGLHLRLRCKQKQKPSKEPRLWRNGLGPLEGWPPMVGQYNGHHSREHPRSGGVTKAPALPTRHRSACPGDDSQQETGYRGGKGGRRLCGRISGSAVSYARGNAEMQESSTGQHHQKNKNRTATPPRRTEPEKRPEPEPRRNRAIWPETRKHKNEPLGQETKETNSSQIWEEKRENAPKHPEKPKNQEPE